MAGVTSNSRQRLVTAVLVVASLAPCVVQVFGKYALDLDVYRAGGRAVLHGHDLYGFRLHDNGFTYPPFAALLFTRLALLGLGAATVVLTVVSLACLAVVLRRCAGELLSGRPPALVVFGLAALVACEPVRATLWTGQIDLVLLALVTRDLLPRAAPRWRGVGIGVAAAIKLTPAIFVVYLLTRHRYRDATRAGAAFALATAVGWVALPDDSARFWTREVFDGSGLGDLSARTNQSLLGLLLRLVPSIAFPVWAVLVVPMAVLGLRAARWASRRGQEVLAVGTVGVTGCVVSPVSWSHHWVWCVPLVLGLAATAQTPAMRVWAVGTGAVFFGQYLVPGPLVRAWPPAHLVLDNAFLVVTVLMPLVWAHAERRTRRLHSPEASAKLGVGTL